MKPGTRVKLYIGTSRVGGFSGIVMKIENEKGENIAGSVETWLPSVWTALQRLAAPARRRQKGMTT